MPCSEGGTNSTDVTPRAWVQSPAGINQYSSPVEQIPQGMTAPGITLSKLVYEGTKGRSSDKAGEVMGVSSNVSTDNASDGESGLLIDTDTQGQAGRRR
jgi:hypothetical protein